MFRTVFKNDTLTFFGFGLRDGCCCFLGLPKSFPPLSSCDNYFGVLDLRNNFLGYPDFIRASKGQAQN
jgi:hypothetical protein